MTGVHVRTGALLAAALIFFGVLAGAAGADVVQRSSASTGAFGSSFSLPGVAVSAGSGRLLAVGVSTTQGSQVTGVSYAGSPLTLRLAQDSGATRNGARAEIWTLSNPAVGTGSVVVSFAQNVSAVIGVATYDGVDALNPVLGPAEDFAGDTSHNAASAILDNTAGDADFGVLALGNPGNVTASPSLGPSTDTVTANALWNRTAGGAIIGAGATRSGNTGANRAPNAGIVYHWNYADGSAFTPYVLLMAGLNKAAGAITPTVTTAAPADVTKSSATLGGDVTSDGGAAITDRGYVLCAAPCTPTVDGVGQLTVRRTGTTGPFSATSVGLVPSTTYNYAAFAVNSAGTAYGAQTSFRTLADNHAPVAGAGGPYTVNEGSGLSLDASGSTDADGDALTYRWDLDGDGQYDDATGVRPVLTPAQAATFGMGDGPATHAVAVQVADPSGATSTASANVTVNNRAPAPSVTGVPADAVEGTPWRLHVSATDPSAADTAAGIHYAVDTDDDGTWDIGGESYASATTTTDFTITPTDSGPQTVDVLAVDKDGTSATLSIDYDVANADPTATLGTGGPVDEGSPGRVSFSGQADPSSADAAAGFHYAYDLNGDGTWDIGDGTYARSPSTASADVPTTDNGTVTVRAKIIDKDGGSNTYNKTLTVNNVAPDGTVANDGPVDEGSSATVSVTGATDPSSADTSAGLRYAYDVGDDGTWESGDGATYAGSTTASTYTVATDDDGDTPVRVAIVDKDGGITTHVTHVVANGVAPTVTAMDNDGPVDEGGDLTVTLTGAADPSGADTAAGFHYAYDTDGDGSYDVGDGTYAGSPATPTLTIHTDDSGSYLVRGLIIDKDDKSTLYATRVTVDNVAPVAAVAAPDATPRDTDLLFTVSARDVSSVDEAGSFTYNVNWGDGTPALRQNGAKSMLALHRYPTAGTYTVTVTATDKNGGTSAPATTTVTIPAPPAPPAPDAPARTTTPATTPSTPVTAQSTPVFAKVQSLTVSPRCVAAAAATSRSVRIRYRLSSAAAVRVTLQRSTGSHAVASCPPLRGSQQADGRYAPGSYKPVSVRQTTGSSGGTSLTIAKGSKGGAVGSVASVRPQALIAKGGKLAPGTYLLTVTTLSADGRVQDTARVKFWVLKAKKARTTKRT